MAVAVDVVIVTRNTREMTVGCVRSVLAATGGDLELSCVVVDNASNDGTPDAIERELPEVRVVRNDHNAPYGRACNQGLAGGHGDYVLILNSDIVAAPYAIPTLIRFLLASPEHVAAGGRLVDPGSDRVQVGHTVRRFPRLLPQAAQMLGLERHWPANPVSRRALGFDVDYGHTQDVEQPPGSCLAIRRRDFDAVGGFDEGFYYWYEDVDLCVRLRERGRIAYVHDARFEHIGSATFAGWPRHSAERLLSWYGGVFRYFAKHRPRWEQIAIRALAGALAATRALAWLPRDRTTARAIWQVARLARRPGVPADLARPL